MRSTLLVLATCAACGFGGGNASPDGPPPDELEFLIDSAEEFKGGSPVQEGAYTSAAGTVEPMAWLPGLLLTEIDDGAGPFGSWAMKPARDQMANVGLMTPKFDANPKPPGAPSGAANFILWFSGEIRLDAGAQKLAIAAGDNATAFADILDSTGAVLAACTTSSDCAITAPAAGWYPLRMGWSRPEDAANNSFDVQWAAGVGIPAVISPDRVRVAVHEPALAGWRVEGYEVQRSISPLVNGTALNYREPFSLAWTPGLLGLDGATTSPSYRSAGQLRVLEEASYDFVVTAGSKAAYRLWIDGEWVSQFGRWNPQPSGPKTESVSRPLAAGWHDVVLEGYEQGSTSNNVGLTFGKTGQALKSPAVAEVRPLLGPGTSVVAALSTSAVPLVKNVFVPQLVTLPAIANAASATAVDISLRLQPKVWAGLEVRLRAPNSPTAIPLVIDVAGLANDQLGDVHASLTKAELGNVAVSGDWTVEVKHTNAGGNLTAANTLSQARVSVHYQGGAAIGTAEKQIAQSSRYVRTVSLDKPRELRGLIVTAVQPVGSSVTASLQICVDAAALDCGPEISAEQLAMATPKPLAQHVKIGVAFTSDGFASPILDKVALRYKK
jgi:hypothetical protein